MSNAAINPAATSPTEAALAGHNHDPHLAHHFDTPEQQYISAKLGMWIFLGTEILMFGGLFCAYAVYRHNHQEVFEFAHKFLDKWLGAINTLVLITSSLTMAWAVRSSQLGHQKSLRWLLAATIIGGYIFLGIKSVEYHTKWKHGLFIGPGNQFNAYYKGPATIKDEEEKAANEREIAERHGHPEKGAEGKVEAPKVGLTAQPAEPAKTPPSPSPESSAGKVATLVDPTNLAPPDPNASSSDAALIQPVFHDPGGLEPKKVEQEKQELELKDLNGREQHQIYTFFAVYFVMTGLHGLHVVIGMALITWVLLRALGPKNTAWAIPLIPASIGVFLAIVGVIILPSHGEVPSMAGTVGMKLIIIGLILAVLCVIWAMIWVPMRRNRSGESEFGPTYFTPVDLVGLYWHLVDLIWIFLFPLLYLIH